MTSNEQIRQGDRRFEAWIEKASTMTHARGGIVDYVAKCFATGEVVCEPTTYRNAWIAAQMETIARQDVDAEFASSAACAAWVDANTFEVTPAACA